MQIIRQVDIWDDKPLAMNCFSYLCDMVKKGLRKLSGVA